MAEDQRVIYVAASTQQAHLLKNALLEQGIRAFVSNDPLQVIAGKVPSGLPTAPRVVVGESEAEEARQIALDFERTWREPNPRDELETQDAAEQDEPWPLCPSCHRPRHTSCPVCGTAGTSFPRGFLPPGAAQAAERLAGVSSPRLLLCGICDEPFVPQFAAQCEWCGHRFADGRQLPLAIVPDDLEMNERAWIVVAGLAILLVGVLALCIYITPSR
jgi:hypothetical protein